MAANGPAGQSAPEAHARVLLLSPPFTAGAGEVCLDLVAGAGRADAMLFVLDGRTPDEQLRAVRTHQEGTLPPRVGFLTFDDGGRSSAASGGYDGPAWVGSVGSPGNLTDLGVALSNRIEVWSEDGADVAVCFEPVTTLLQYSSVADVYRFMHVFGQQVRAVGGRVHYHLDPTAHEETVVNQLTSLCDAVVELDPDGDVTVRSR